MAIRKFGFVSQFAEISAVNSTPSGYLSFYPKADHNLYIHGDGVESKIWTNNNDGSGSGLDADLLDGQQGSYYAAAVNSEYRQTLNTVRNNVGSPYIRDVALIHGVMSNKLRFIPALLQEDSTDGITWNTSIRLSTDALKDLMIGEGTVANNMVIPNGGVGSSGYYRLTWDASQIGYKYLDFLYLNCCTFSNTVNIKVEKYHPDLGWINIANDNVSNWPGHVIIPHASIPFHPSPTVNVHWNKVRITFSVSSFANTYGGFQVSGIEWFGGYPGEKRNIYSVDRDKNVYFPAVLGGSRLQSLIAQGTAPLTVASTTKVTNLNVDYLDDHHGAYYLDYNNFTNTPTSFPPSAHTHDDRYYTETESDAKYALVGHTHDDRYYTETESDSRYPILTGGLIPSTYLPGYVDDVLEFANLAGFPATGESGKIYVAIDTNITYRWSGTAYVIISATLALGETSATAYRGDRGKIAYDHSQTAHQNIISGTGFVKASGTTLSYDDSIYITGITKAMVEAVLTGNITSHTHNYTNNTGTVTSVAMSTPTGLTVTGSPITVSGTLALAFTSGYSIPTTAKQTNWDTAYTHSQAAHQTIISGIGFVKASGTTLSYDNSTYSLSSHSHTLVDLSDVAFLSLADKQIIRYNASSSSWVNFTDHWDTIADPMYTTVLSPTGDYNIKGKEYFNYNVCVSENINSYHGIGVYEDGNRGNAITLIGWTYATGLSICNEQITIDINGIMTINDIVSFQLPYLAGTGNGIVMVDADGDLYRGTSATGLSMINQVPNNIPFCSTTTDVLNGDGAFTFTIRTDKNTLDVLSRTDNNAGEIRIGGVAKSTSYPRLQFYTNKNSTGEEVKDGAELLNITAFTNTNYTYAPSLQLIGTAVGDFSSTNLCTKFDILTVAGVAQSYHPRFTIDQVGATILNSSADPNMDLMFRIMMAGRTNNIAFEVSNTSGVYSNVPTSLNKGLSVLGTTNVETITATDTATLKGGATISGKTSIVEFASDFKSYNTGTLGVEHITVIGGTVAMPLSTGAVHRLQWLFNNSSSSARTINRTSPDTFIVDGVSGQTSFNIAAAGAALGFSNGSGIWYFFRLK